MNKKNKKQPTLSKDVKHLKTDVSVLKTDVSVLKTDVSVLKTDVSVLKTDVSVLKTDVSVLKTDVSTIKDTMATKDDLNREVKRLDSSINFVYTEFCDFRYYVEENMLTKRDFLSHIEGIEDILAEMRDFNMQRHNIESQIGRLDDKAENHEKRIIVLEKSPR